jgi:hypothetical protein
MQKPPKKISEMSDAELHAFAVRIVGAAAGALTRDEEPTSDLEGGPPVS